MRRLLLLAVLLALGCSHPAPPPPPPPVLYGPYQLTWTAYPTATAQGIPIVPCNGATTAPAGEVCVSWLLLIVNGTTNEVSVTATSFPVGTLTAGSYLATIQPVGYDPFGDALAGPISTATIVAGPATATTVKME